MAEWIDGVDRRLEQAENLIIGHLTEVRVPGSNRSEPRRSINDNDFIGRLSQSSDRVRRCNRYGQDNRCGASSLQHADRRFCRRAGCDAVIDQDHNPAFDIRWRPVSAK